MLHSLISSTITNRYNSMQQHLQFLRLIDDIGVSKGVVVDTALALEHFVFKTHYHNEPSKGFIAIAVKP